MSHRIGHGPERFGVLGRILNAGQNRVGGLLASLLEAREQRDIRATPLQNMFGERDGPMFAPELTDAQTIAMTLADFTPGVGDVKALGFDMPQAIAQDRPVSAALAGLSAIPALGLAGDIARRLLKPVDDLPETGGLLGRVTEPEGIRAFHGSPHDFDQFSLDAIGTGEGAQAYGHGLYFAEDEGVARFYRDALRPMTEVRDLEVGGVPIYQRGQPVDYSPGRRPDGSYGTPSAEDIAKATLQEQLLIDEWALREAFDAEGVPGVKKKLIEALDDAEDYARSDPDLANDYLPYYQQVRKNLDDDIGTRIRFNPGEAHMYEVRINASPDDFIDYDAPLAEQPLKVQEVAERLGSTLELRDGMSLAGGGTLRIESAVDGTPKYFLEMGDSRFRLSDGDVTRLVGSGVEGRSLYQSLVTELGSDAAASQALREQGVKGIRYLDGSSRSVGEGSSNFVVFDDSLVEILRKYGIAAMLGVGATQQANQN